MGARTAILLGERELKAGKATVRDMKSGAQTEVALADLVDAVRSIDLSRAPGSARPKRRAAGARRARPRRR